MVILVNRGWVPPQKIRPASRKEGQVEGQVTFDAVVRHTEKVIFQYFQCNVRD
ncbi:unnamed protein product [Gongylonema pulchrum]|uniref:SURF1-like protein n=1 Tax=Gongylonema pulchrum TaxID=637853 RepID=A0A183E4N1_9BILA|nr:unnamed protein product [Gongylonema pulchrum]